MSLCDTFVFLNDVEITKSGYTRRVKISHQADREKYQWLTVPLKKHSDFIRINDLEIDQSKDWRAQHYRKLENVYRKSQEWNEMKRWMQGQFEETQNMTKLSELNILMIKSIARQIGLKCEFINSSDLPVFGKADTYTYRIAKHLKASEYIRGKGEQKYASDPKWKEDEDIAVVEMDYTDFIENDTIGTWRKGYSIIDLMMHQEKTKIFCSDQ